MDASEKNLFQLLAFACSETRQAFDEQTGLSQARRQLLALIAQAGEISHAALQNQMSLDKATITRLVKGFEAEGLVRRRLDPADNRYTLAALTTAGQRVVAELQAAHDVFQVQLLDGISDDDQAVMLRLLQRLRGNIRALRAEPR